MIRIVRIEVNGVEYYARAEGHGFHLLTAAPWAGGRDVGAVVGNGRLLAPVQPSKVVCVGSNYRAHAAEMGKATPDKPRLFLKPPSAIIGPGQPIEIPPETTRVDHEVELGVVIGKRCSRVCKEDALDYVYGYTVCNDVTARDFQKEDGLFARAKGFDSFLPVGPHVVTGLVPERLALGCDVNRKVRQMGNTTDMVFPVAELIAFMSNVMTLEPGDLILTGTPSGVGPLEAGDRVTVTVEGVGSMTNPVVDRSDR
ncbi:5-oxo-1,2,5-tricarboxylic-3-penten acid decarboxylase [Deltaproteobacteria bacterium]|nr:5-oxo-1,2,5-tricarboxylic-3-penten acid decarboxylase [Deltaproteobacteria bacterium]